MGGRTHLVVMVVGHLLVVGHLVVVEWEVGHISRKRLEQEAAEQSSTIQKHSLVILTIAPDMVETGRHQNQ